MIASEIPAQGRGPTWTAPSAGSDCIESATGGQQAVGWVATQREPLAMIRLGGYKDGLQTGFGFIVT